MARMRPQLSSRELGAVQSRAEAKFYKWCSEQLDDSYTVLHSREWIDRDKDGAHEGETDFTICGADTGLLIVEVKGGGVGIDGDRRWYSIDRAGVKRAIKNPFEQARFQRHEIENALEGDGKWRARGEGRCTVGYAVFFPDLLDVSQLVNEQERPKPLVGKASDGSRLLEWIRGALAFWAGPLGIKKLGTEGVRAFDNLFCKPVYVRPALAEALLDEECQRVELTQQQANLLIFLGSRSRARIVGGAGTGKTLIAMEKGRRLTEAGKATLLLCYNRPLADKIKLALSGVQGIDVFAFHQFCSWAASETKRFGGGDLIADNQRKDPLADLYETILPLALVDASGFVSKRFEAIIVDEGQDFRESYWLGVELFLKSSSSLLYVFYDENQAIYSRFGGCPILDQPFELTKNCRNTRFIHEASYRYYSGEPTVLPSAIIGEPVRALAEATLEDQAGAILTKSRDLIDREHVKPYQIQVLVAGIPKESYYTAIRTRANLGSLKISIEGVAASSAAVPIDTVSRFKGLEADVVFLWGPESLVDRDLTEALYVGFSRAKGRLVLVGTAKVKELIDGTNVGK